VEFFLQLRHGAAVQVEYYDLAEPEAQAQFSELFTVAQDRNLPYPLVAVDGVLRLAGSAEPYRIEPLVAQALAAHSTN
jgi:hypothetical protein